MTIDYNIPDVAKSHLTTDHIIPKGRYLNFHQKENIHLGSKNHYIASRKVGQHLFLEIKSTVEKGWDLTLRDTPGTFWIAFQFLGSSSIDAQENSTLDPQHYLGFFNPGSDLCYLFKGGKIWMVLIGTELKNPEQLGREWPTLTCGGNNTFHPLPAVKTAFRNKKILEQIQRIKDTPFSLCSKLNYQAVQLIETYHGDLLQHRKSTQRDDISLFHRAKAYIVEHYMDENIDIKQIALELLTSERTLYRIFQENGLTVNSAIKAIRIHKG